MVSPKLDMGLNRVFDLFYPGTKSWNVEVLQNYFYPWEADAIRKIYVSEACNSDCLVWPKTSKGCYSVKSAYWMLATEAINEAASSFGGAGTKVWKNIWKIRVPPKIKHFMWRSATDSLPTKQNIACRKIPIDETCSLCDDQQETSMHVIWLCDQAKAVWKSVPSFSRLYKVGLVVEFFDVHTQPTRPEVQQHHIKWTKPPEDCYKANFDATLFENSNMAGIGVVIRDCNGNAMGALSQKILLPQSIEHAEALAASRAMTFAEALVFPKSCFREIAYGLLMLSIQRSHAILYLATSLKKYGAVLHL